MYKVKVNDSYKFDISEKEISALDAIETTPNHFHILKNYKSVTASIELAQFNQKYYEVMVNNNTYKVNISDALNELIDQMGFTIGTSKQISKITAPMPGLILEINVKAGDEVNENDNLLILEAMKMENVIKIPHEAVVKKINIVKGQAVDKGQVLIELE